MPMLKRGYGALRNLRGKSGARFPPSTVWWGWGGWGVGGRGVGGRGVGVCGGGGGQNANALYLYLTLSPLYSP